MSSNAVIAGIGHTAHGKLPGRTPLSMTVEAVAKALAESTCREAGICDSGPDSV